MPTATKVLNEIVDPFDLATARSARRVVLSSARRSLFWVVPNRICHPNTRGRLIQDGTPSVLPVVTPVGRLALSDILILVVTAVAWRFGRLGRRRRRDSPRSLSASAAGIARERRIWAGADGSASKGLPWSHE